MDADSYPRHLVLHLDDDARGEAALRMAPLPLVAFDREGRVTLWNDAAEALFGWSAREVVGRVPPAGGASTLYPPDDAEAALDAFLARACARLPDARRQPPAGPAPAWGVDGVLPTRAGGEVEVVAWVAPLRDASGQEIGTVAQFADVGERKRAERERAVVREHLHRVQKIEAVGRLSGGVAHDFNNLLMAIKGNAELAALELPEESPAREDLAEIRRAAARAAELTRQLLAFSQRQVLRPERMDLNERLRKLLPVLREAAGGEIALDLGENVGVVELDASQLEQVLKRLLDNARAAVAPGGGSITVVTRAVTLDPDFSRELLYDVPAGPYVNLLVQDTGVGMDDATRENALEPFFTTRERGKGTGLGLSTVYGIVKQSGGFIEVRSVPGSGTEVSMLFPRVAAEGAEPVAVRSPVRTFRGTETVLLVEDEDSVLALTRRVLARSGYRVMEAASGPEALRMAAAHPGTIHLLVTDVVMPGMLGPELAQRLREARPDTRVLFMSGYNEQIVTGRGVLRPGTVFMAKPFSPSAFLERVREVLDDPPPDAA
ncbi:MAG TPA: response regulator [Longimicrobiales bacterium]|nr:response regulator [Longimicrobiales bacterium]